MHVEDHPIEYNEFEGTIPQGQYGGGTVMIWDRGTWEPEDDPHKGYEKGHLDFTLDGEKLHGRWHLVRMHAAPGENERELAADQVRRRGGARHAGDPDILEEEPRSVVSGRSIEEIAEGKGQQRVWHSNRGVAENVKARRHHGRRGDAGARARTPRSPQRGSRGQEGANRSPRNAAKSKRKSKGHGSAPCPTSSRRRWRRSQRAPPSSADWVHEIKFDGYRIQARLDARQGPAAHPQGSRLDREISRTSPRRSRTLPARDRADRRRDRGRGRERHHQFFGAAGSAQARARDDRFVYYVFDLLHLDGRDLTGQPLIERKAALEDVARAAEAARPDPLQRAFRRRRREHAAATPASWSSKASSRSAATRLIAPAAAMP